MKQLMNESKSQSDANAKLIAAAPELLKALKGLQAKIGILVCAGKLDEFALELPEVLEARKAIDKAEIGR